MKASFQAHQSAANSVLCSLLLPPGSPMPLYRLGDRVLWKEHCNHEVIGTICGFQYLAHPDYIFSWSYSLNVESAKSIYADGSYGRLIVADIEMVSEDKITHLNQERVSLV